MEFFEKLHSPTGNGLQPLHGYRSRTKRSIGRKVNRNLCKRSATFIRPPLFRRRHTPGAFSRQDVFHTVVEIRHVLRTRVRLLFNRVVQIRVKDDLLTLCLLTIRYEQYALAALRLPNFANSNVNSIVIEVDQMRMIFCPWRLGRAGVNPTASALFYAHHDIYLFQSRQGTKFRLSKCVRQ